MGLSFHINGLYRYLDFPDLAALAAPRALMVINGSQDRLFALDGVKAAFDKIARLLRQGGRARPRAVPDVRRPARVQPRDAGGGVGVAGEVGLGVPSELIELRQRAIPTTVSCVFELRIWSLDLRSLTA